MLYGSSLNFLIQKVLPFVETSFMKVAASLCFSGSMASSTGCALLMCLALLCASLTMKSFSAWWLVNMMFVGMLSKRLCQT